MKNSEPSNASKSCGVVLRMHDVSEKIGLRRSALYNKLNSRSSGFDPSFPRPIRISARAVGWLDSEVDAWVASRARERDGKEV